MDASCQDCLGSNMKAVGGCVGLATGMAFAAEYQGEATPGGRGFVLLGKMPQRRNLEIWRIIDRNRRGISPGDMLEWANSSVDHL